MALYDSIAFDGEPTHYPDRGGEVTAHYRFFIMRNGCPTQVTITVLWDVAWQPRHDGPVTIGYTPVCDGLQNSTKAVRFNGDTIPLRLALDLLETSEWLNVGEGDSALAELARVTDERLAAYSYNCSPDGGVR